MGALTEAYLQAIRRRFETLSEPANPHEMNALLRLCARWRSEMLANTYIAHHGSRILGGPFAGMEYVNRATEGALIPRLLGTYEAELHPHLQAFCDEGVECVIDVGCAEGYYAVGLARMLPAATVYAYDIDPRARELCAALAARNGVGDRVVVRELFQPQDFDAYAGRRALVIMDTEGAEMELLRPDLAPALAEMRVIVETHSPEATRTVAERFAATHEVVRVDLAPKMFDLPPWMDELAHLDQLLAVWEWRGIPTPWLVMRPKA